MATGRSTDGEGCFHRKSVLERIEKKQQELLNKLDAVEKAVQSEKYATPHFSDTILKEMYRFYREGQFCDFKIKVEGRQYQVHRLVMSSSSDYFRAMLSHDMIETRKECTSLQELTVRGVEPLIEYAYTGRLDLNLTNVTDVMTGATFLQIAGAILLCVAFLKENMNFDNAEELLKIGDLFSVPSLKEYYRNYLLKNFLAFCESDAFLRIDADSLADYLSDDGLQTTSESILFHHCLNWHYHDLKNRHKDAHKVFEKIRFNLDDEALINFASSNEPFISNPRCCEILEFHEHYMKEKTKWYIKNTTCRTRVRSKRWTIVQFGGMMETNEEYDTFQDMLNQPLNEHCGWDHYHYFHPDLKSWFPLGDMRRWMRTRLSHQAFVEVNGCGVLVGGYEYIVDDDNVNKITIKDVKMFSAQGHFQVHEMKSLQHARARHAAVFLDGYIYAIGGKDDRQSLSSVECLDCHAEKWRYVKALPKKLFDHAAVALQGKIYVTGGSVFVRNVSKNVWCFDPNKNNWKKMQDMNSARAGHGMVCLKDSLYVAGGHNGNREALNPDGHLRCLISMEVYNVSTKQWTRLQGMKQAITFFQMKVLDGRILVMGGLDSAGLLTQYMHEYEEDSNTWKVFGELLRPLRNACCGVIQLKLTDTGCMEDEGDDYLDKYNRIWAEASVRKQFESDIRVMENFEPGDYELDDDSNFEPGDYELDDDSNLGPGDYELDNDSNFEPEDYELDDRF